MGQTAATPTVRASRCVAQSWCLSGAVGDHHSCPSCFVADDVRPSVALSRETATKLLSAVQLAIINAKVFLPVFVTGV